MQFELRTDIPIPRKEVPPPRERIWEFQNFTEPGMSRFYANKSIRQAYAAISSYRKQADLPLLKFVAQEARERVEGVEITGVRVWRDDDHKTPLAIGIGKGRRKRIPPVVDGPEENDTVQSRRETGARLDSKEAFRSVGKDI